MKTGRVLVCFSHCLMGFFPHKGAHRFHPWLTFRLWVIFLKLRPYSCSAYFIEQLALVSFLIFIYFICSYFHFLESFCHGSVFRRLYLVQSEVAWSIFIFWYWKAVVNHKLFFTKVSVRFCTSFPVCFQGFQRKMYCQHWAHLFWVKNTTDLYVIIFHGTAPYIDRIWRKNEWLIAFDLEIPTNLEFLVVVSPYFTDQGQWLPSVWLYGPTPEWTLVPRLGIHNLRDATEPERSLQRTG